MQSEQKDETASFDIVPIGGEPLNHYTKET
jgi:hypothetical protein